MENSIEKLEVYLKSIIRLAINTLIVTLIILSINIFFGYKYYKATEAINALKESLPAVDTTSIVTEAPEVSPPADALGEGNTEGPVDSNGDLVPAGE